MDFSFLGFKPLPFSAKSPEMKGFDYFGVPTLTSLALRNGGNTVVLEECVMTVNQEKNIVSTPVQGRDGTIKEFVSDGDFSISIEAAVCSYVVHQEGDDKEDQRSMAYPISEIEDIVALLNIKESLEVQSDFLTFFGIRNVVVKAYAMVQETHSNRQSFTAQLLSDSAYEIKIKEDAAINE